MGWPSVIGYIDDIAATKSIFLPIITIIAEKNAEISAECFIDS
jgi:hypothetical protein